MYHYTPNIYIYIYVCACVCLCVYVCVWFLTSLSSHPGSVVDALHLQWPEHALLSPESTLRHMGRPGSVTSSHAPASASHLHTHTHTHTYLCEHLSLYFVLWSFQCDAALLRGWWRMEQHKPYRPDCKPAACVSVHKTLLFFSLTESVLKNKVPKKKNIY